MTAYKITIPLKQSATVLSFDFRDYISANQMEAVIEAALDKGSEWVLFKDDAGRRVRLFVEEIAGVIVMDVAKAMMASIEEQKAGQKLVAKSNNAPSIAVPVGGFRPQ